MVDGQKKIGHRPTMSTLIDIDIFGFCGGIWYDDDDPTAGLFYLFSSIFLF